MNYSGSSASTPVSYDSVHEEVSFSAQFQLSPQVRGSCAYGDNGYETEREI